MLPFRFQRLQNRRPPKHPRSPTDEAAASRQFGMHDFEAPFVTWRSVVFLGVLWGVLGKKMEKSGQISVGFFWILWEGNVVKREIKWHQGINHPQSKCLKIVLFLKKAQPSPLAAVQYKSPPSEAFRDDVLHTSSTPHTGPSKTRIKQRGLDNLEILRLQRVGWLMMLVVMKNKHVPVRLG